MFTAAGDGCTGLTEGNWAEHRQGPLQHPYTPSPARDTRTPTGHTACTHLSIIRLQEVKAAEPCLTSPRWFQHLLTLTPGSAPHTSTHTKWARSVGWVADLSSACLTLRLCVPMILVLPLFWMWHAYFLCVCQATTMCPCPSVCPCCRPMSVWSPAGRIPLPSVFPDAVTSPVPLP